MAKVFAIASRFLPECLRRPLQLQLERVQEQHGRDLERGGGSVYLPYALQGKYPKAHRSWSWQYVFPANKLSKDPRSQEVRRHHVSDKTLQHAVKSAIARLRLSKPTSCHTLRDSFTAHFV